MKLYGYFRSSAAYRVRIALLLKGIDVEHVPVHMYKDGGQHKKSEYRAKNPQQLVPTLELDDGTLLHQSLAIIEYLDHAFGGTRLIPEDPLAASKVRAASYAIACDIHPINNLRVMNYLKHEMGHSEQDVKTWYAHWVRDGGLLGFQDLIQQVGQFSFGDQPTMADCCLVPQLYNARRFQVPLEGLERLVDIDAKAAGLDAFKKAHPVAQIDAE
ncbi:maleylacetoacetate isomerase [Rhizobium sp. Root1204]|uniref:maleylacetoacetate isomerase n=1 Tax=Rhizobium sp. Root1204 TaxID=1736428 RepID=UPI0007125EB9|nr:maleylacetoacetate isomerase [Rhizobium sp. Root1204]KQV41313.1 maleylacetoacetate isomerase [Rhizobium sp. Root1204]